MCTHSFDSSDTIKFTLFCFGTLPVNVWLFNIFSLLITFKNLILNNNTRYFFVNIGHKYY